MQDFYRLADGVPMADADAVVHKVCKKKVWDMIYEARIYATRHYHACHGMKITKTEARTKPMTREQFLEVNIEH